MTWFCHGLALALVAPRVQVELLLEEERLCIVDAWMKWSGRHGAVFIITHTRIAHFEEYCSSRTDTLVSMERIGDLF